jgi:hypothetical protein
VVNSPTSIGLSTSPTANIPINAKAAGTGEAIEIQSVSGATPVACASTVSCASTLLPQAYTPASPANTTTTWQNNVPNNAFSGGTGGRVIPGSATCCATTSGSGVITAVSGTPFAATDVGRPVSGFGIGAGAVVTTFTSATSITVSVNSTNTTGALSATNQGVTLTLGGLGWWQSTGASGNTGTLVLGVRLFGPQSVTSVAAHWLDSSKCPGGAGITCTGFQPTAYTIATSTNGSTFTTCATVTTNAAFNTTDACSASGVSYIEYVITAWNAPTPYQGYGPALNYLIIS